MKKTAFVTTLVFSVLLTATTTAAITSRFPDVPTDHWAYNAIERLKENGIVHGYTDGMFRPNDMISRAEVAVMIDNNNQVLMDQVNTLIKNKSTSTSSNPIAPKPRDDSTETDGLGEAVTLNYDPNCVVEGAVCAAWGEVKIGSGNSALSAKAIPCQDDPLHMDIKFYQNDKEANIPTFTTDSMLDVGSKYFSVKLWNEGDKTYLSPNSKSGEPNKYYVFSSNEGKEGWQEFFGTGI